MLRSISLIITLLLSGLASAWASNGALPRSPHAVVLLYHDINTTSRQSIPSEQLTKQLDYLEAHNFHVWPLHSVVSAIENSDTLPDQVVAISFDSDHHSVYEQAYPLLKQRKWPFTVFVNSDIIDAASRQASAKNNLSWEQLREMSEHGATIANRSTSTSSLIQQAHESDKSWHQRAQSAINTGQDRLSEMMGLTPPLFAYPQGEYDQALQSLLRMLGYAAFGQQPGAFGVYTNSMAIPRFAMHSDANTPDRFADQVSSLPLPLVTSRFVDNPLPAWQTKPVLALQLAEGLPAQGALHCLTSAPQQTLDLQWTDASHVLISPPETVAGGRSFYECIMPIAQTGRYYWYSHLWIHTESSATSQ